MNPQCSGQHRAHLAGQHDHSPCVDCGTEYPTGSLWIYPHGYACDACHHGHVLEEKQFAGPVPSLTSEQRAVSVANGPCADVPVRQLAAKDRPDNARTPDNLSTGLFQLGIDLMRAQAAEWTK